jgi:hypothetical protein
MAISFVQCTTGLGSSGTTDFGTYTDGLLVVSVNSSTDNVTAVTFNGVAGTRRVHDTSNAATVMLDLWTVPVGSMTGSVSWSITGGTSVGVQVSGYSGVDQTTPVNTTDSDNCFVCSVINCEATPTLDNCWAVAFFAKNGGCASGTPVGMTNRSLPGNDNGIGFGDSDGVVTNGVATLQQVSSVCTQQFSGLQVILAPSAAAATATFVPKLMSLKVG